MLVQFVAAQQDGYRLRQEDVLHIQVRRLVSTTPDVDQDVAVDQNGYVNPPFLAPIKAEGMTITDLEKDLREKYVALFKLQPDQTLVSAIITSYRPVRASVVGAVPNPGTYTMKPGDTLHFYMPAAGMKRHAGKVLHIADFFEKRSANSSKLSKNRHYVVQSNDSRIESTSGLEASICSSSSR